MSTNLPLGEVLARIEAWYSENVPALHATLRPGTSDAELDALEEATGLQLPSAFRTLYRWHDGQNWSAGGVFGLGFESLEGVQHEWETWKELEPDFGNETENHASHPPGAITERYINTGWLGFLTDGSGNSVGLDLNPGPAGTLGQVITFGRDEENKSVLADSLDTFFREYLARLEAGRVTAVRLSGFADEVWSVQLHDASGHHQEDYGGLADVFPGFGAAPERFTR
ncbi:SMI1/KNR4 family protein [Deinococcus alpinitundrae]|uniref:SMI1/KNR4 family protein n=1 Tax=Deinococcus alpinitundrae TaxID=468913 RepID=UPI001ED91A80|nr:SMI1/KNR4 family protein [Deinococcus alpinitundrae]